MKMITIALLILATLGMAQAEPRKSSRNYILRRQQVTPGLGTPSHRMNYGRRQIDVYRNGLMFEGDTVVGIKGKR